MVGDRLLLQPGSVPVAGVVVHGLEGLYGGREFRITSGSRRPPDPFVSKVLEEFEVGHDSG